MKDFLQFAQKTLLILITLLGGNFVSYAQNWDQIIKANAGDRNNKTSGARSSNDAYGFSVSMYSTYAIVGAPKEDENASGKNTLTDAGAAYILHLVDGSWKQVKKICPSVRAAQNGFGFSVSMSGNYVIVGAYSEARIAAGLPTLDYAGAAYIFQKDQGGEDNWGEVKRITASVPSMSDQFGYSVAISGDYVVVGALLDSQDALETNTKNQAGSAYIFKKDQGGTNNWGQLKKITASDRAVTDLFGKAVAINGDNIVVGAHLDDVIVSGTTVWDAGSAYIFNKTQGGNDNWGQIKKVIATNPVTSGSFGSALAINGDYVVVGSEMDSGIYTNSGAAYVYGKNKGGTNNWGVVKKLVASVPATNDHFGYSVSINGNNVIVGANFESQNSGDQNTLTESGSAYIFSKNQGSVDNWGQVRKITASYRQEYDSFGSAVAVYGVYALVGALNEDDDENETNTIYGSGSAYFYRQDQGGVDNWGFVRKMIMEDLTPNDNFGYSVSISGKYAIVGSPFEDEDKNGVNTISDAGAAYIFYNNGSKWSQVKKITAITRWANDNFGQSVSINGKYAIVGAPQGNLNGIEEGYLENAGAAYIFYMDQGGAGNWGQVKKITALNRAANDLFGKSVSMGENVAVVGAPLTDGGSGTHQYGSAYVFAKDQGSANGWGQVKELTAAIRLNDANFGQSVSVSGNYMLIGASGDSYNGGGSVIPSTGAAYVFKKDTSTGNTWALVKKIYATAHTAFDSFGFSVSISGSYALVGAPNDSENSLEADSKSKSGSAYLFKKELGGTENWGQVKKLTAADRAKDDHFGYSVSMSGNYAMIGAPEEDENALLYSSLDMSGSAYIFRRDQGAANYWGQMQKITADNRHFGDQFGYSVGISDTYAAVGSPFDTRDAAEQNIVPGAGSAYIFHTTPASGARTSASTFDAQKRENQALISWTPVSETNFDYFEVQKSTDGLSWETIKEVTAIESDELKLYSFADLKPFAGNNFYQVKTVDQEGNIAFTEVKSLLFDENKGEIVTNKKIGIYPNPVIDRLYVSGEELNKIVSVTIVNTMGRVVANSSKITNEGLATDHLSAGIYIVQIKKTDGRMEAQKVVVVK